MSLEFNRGNNNCIPLSGIAYVIIPEDCDTAEYVQRCYRNNTLSIGGSTGATAMHNVKVLEGVLDKIKFPSNGSTQGSAVIWLRESFYNKPVVIGALPEGGTVSNLCFKNQQRIYQEAAQRIAEVFLDALNSRVLISAVGDLSKPAEVVIKANSRNDEGDVVNVESKDLVKVSAKTYLLNLTENFTLRVKNNDGKVDSEGNINGIEITLNQNRISVSDNYGNNILFDENGISIADRWDNNITTSEKEIYLVDNHNNEILLNEEQIYILDSNENKILLNKEHIQLLCQKFDVGEGKEQMILGNTLVDLLGQLIDAICNLTVITSSGASGTPINAASFTAIKSKLETALSKLSNTD